MRAGMFGWPKCFCKFRLIKWKALADGLAAHLRMSEIDNDPQVLNQYLLGALPEAEIERLDELAITDDQFAATLIDVENELVDGYVREQLRGETLKRFKAHYLSSAKRRDRVKFAMALRNSLEPETPWVPVAGTSQRSRLAGWFALPVFQWATAVATIGLVLIAGWLAFENSRLRRQAADTEAREKRLARRAQELQSQLDSQRDAAQQKEQELAQLRAQQSRAQPQKGPESGLVATLFLTPQLRSARQIPIVTIEPTTNSMVAHLELEPNDYSTYRVELIDSSNPQAAWTSVPLKPGVKGDHQTLSVSIPAGLLKPRSYNLRVFGLAPDGTREMVSDYPFRVVK